MLIMKCPECEKIISSGLLAEIATICCQHCGEDVPVKNVMVSSNGFTFDRNDLMKRFFRYRKLLDEVIDERNLLTASSSTSRESRRSLEQFLSILQGMMTGARDNFRYQFESPLPVKFSHGGHSSHATFIDLSMEGGCLALPGSHPLPRVKGHATLSFVLPEQDAALAIGGEICWTQKAVNADPGKHRVGIKFHGLEESARATLWRFILSVAAQPPQ